MKKLFFSLLLLTALSFHSFGWGQNGHRVVGQLAEWHLKKKVLRKVNQVLDRESLAMVSVWMDEIRSETAYDYTNTWHWVTIPDGEKYDESIQEPTGNAYDALLKIIGALKTGGLTPKEEAEYLKMLVHLVGDLHQPLHVGRGDDKGGNDIRVNYFGQETNLHSVWDTRIIESQNLSFTELAKHLNTKVTPAKVNELQSADPSKWLDEAMACRPMVYDIPEDNRISYSYNYQYYPIIEERLLAAGIRLAGILNEIYG
ncbi:S1/P1 nuclease [Pararhodonellum marinum]|uniref:S1/P1 nuclease n=1 Tax=Pararhodonellum marinum TaxID=2755358 RepID=UPI001890917F|nr:S1/P1 nuclease [Pararhodonellum marinum]